MAGPRPLDAEDEEPRLNVAGFALRVGIPWDDLM